MKRILWLLPVVAVAANAPAPRPLTPDERIQVLAAAVETQQAELAVHRLDAQYRAAREGLVAAHEQAARKEEELARKLQREAKAANCKLSPKAEWLCEKEK